MFSLYFPFCKLKILSSYFPEGKGKNSITIQIFSLDSAFGKKGCVTAVFSFNSQNGWQPRVEWIRIADTAWLSRTLPAVRHWTLPSPWIRYAPICHQVSKKPLQSALGMHDPSKPSRSFSIITRLRILLVGRVITFIWHFIYSTYTSPVWCREIFPRQPHL